MLERLRQLIPQDREARLFLLLAAIGFGLVISKAVLAPITQDEAWIFNDAIRRGIFETLLHCPRENNHFLQSALSATACVVFGNEPWVLRLPSILAYGVILACLWRLARSLIEVRWLRLMVLAPLVLHPYLIDYCSLARGYALMSAFCLSGLVLLLGEKITPRRLVLASLCLGMGMWAHLLTAQFGLCVCGCYLLVRVPTWKERLSVATCLAGPGALFTFLVYLPNFSIFRKNSFYYGAAGLSDSLESLRFIASYIPQSLLTIRGNPRVMDPEILSWNKQWLGAGVHSVLTSWPVLLLFFGLLLAGLGTELVGRRRKIHILVLSSCLFYPLWLALLRVCLGIPLPLGRMWMPLLILLSVASLAAVDSIIRVGSFRWRCSGRWVVAGTAFLICLGQADRLGLYAFWEYPDAGAIPRSVEAIVSKSKGKEATIGYPWYLHACLQYYQTTGKIPPQIQLAPMNLAMKPFWDYMIVNTSNMPIEDTGEYEPVFVIPRHRICILRRVRPLIPPTAPPL